jgi:hypothetical protein
MLACRICMANGHEAVKMPSGDYVCPLGGATGRPPAAVAHSSAVPGEVVLSSAEVLELRTILSALVQRLLLLPRSVPHYRFTREGNAILRKIYDVKPREELPGRCECAHPTRGFSSFHCGNCGRVRR